MCQKILCTNKTLKQYPKASVLAVSPNTLVLNHTKLLHSFGKRFHCDWNESAHFRGLACAEHLKKKKEPRDNKRAIQQLQ